MKDFSQIMNDSNQQSEEINESILIGTLLASACLAWCATPLLQPVTNSLGEGLKSFWGFLFNRKKEDPKDPKKTNPKEDPKDPKKTNPKEDPKDPKKTNPKEDPKDPKKTNPKEDPKDPKKTNPKEDPKDPKKTNPKEDPKTDDMDEEESRKAYNTVLMMATESNKNEKDPKVKKKNESTIQFLVACSFDDNGNELPMKDRMAKLKNSMSKEQFEAFSKEMKATYEKNKGDDIKKALKKAKDSVKPADYEKMMKKAKEVAKTTNTQLAKEQDAMAEYEAQMKAIEEKIAKKDAQSEKLKKKLEELKNNPPKTMAESITGVKSKSSKKSNDSTEEVKKDANGNVLKQEKVTDPETGKKISVTTHTGPRGGKFYYPEGKPKTPQNKVYVKESNSLYDYLLGSFE